MRGFGTSGFRQDVKKSDKTYGFSMTGTSNRIFALTVQLIYSNERTKEQVQGIVSKNGKEIATSLGYTNPRKAERNHDCIVILDDISGKFVEFKVEFWKK